LLPFIVFVVLTLFPIKLGGGNFLDMNFYFYFYFFLFFLFFIYFFKIKSKIFKDDELLKIN